MPDASPRVPLRLLPERYAICRYPLTDDGVLPALPPVIGFASLTVTDREISLVCAEQVAPEGAEIDAGWRALYAEGPMPFALTGVIASLVGPLSAEGLSVFVTSTYDGDVLLVEADALDRAMTILTDRGHAITT